MQQHPVPQNISSYQFHLVGDMTLKQFLELAGGVLVGVLFYVTGLPGIIKLPLILFSVAFGAALAFIPLEERPLEQWIFAFFRSVYSPTLFHWEKREPKKYFADETAQIDETAPKPASTISKIPFLSKLEESENSYLSKLTGLFNPGATHPQVAPLPQTVTQPPPGNVVTISIPKPQEPQGQVLSMGSTAPFPTPTTETAKRDVSIPQTTYISLDKHTRPQVVVEEKVTEKVNLQTTSVSPTLTGQSVSGQAQQAIFSLDAAPPSIPTIPNTVSGQVMDANKKIVEGAILEIVDEANRPVRALKTNKAGHFIIVTPLLTGKYKILIEKEGYVFDPIEFEARDAIIQPIAIVAKQL